jgi:hypothetical protein
MKIFISWSGDASHQVAIALKNWLPDVLQSLETEDLFLSSEDIAKGAPWFQALGKVLDQCDFGILCLTPGNLKAPWILYEAGAVSKRVAMARVVPLLIGVEKSELQSPLRDFNAATLDRPEVRKLLAAINTANAGHKLSVTKLNKAFAAFWPALAPQLKAALATARAVKENFEFDVFLSAPMAAYADDAAFQAGRAEFQKVHDALAVDCGLRVYWAAKEIATMDDYETIDVSIEADLAALHSSRYFVLLYPQPMVTSALFEAGYALALNRTSHYFVRDRADLPFLMRELPGAKRDVSIHTGQEWRTFDQLARKIKKQGARWFPS